MTLSHAQILKRKEKKRKARAEKARTIVQLSQLEHSSQWPLIAAYAPFHSRQEHTMQTVIIVRARPNGAYAVGVFLIDTLCLGVKDCFIKMITSRQLPSFLEKIEGSHPMDEVSPSYVATFIHEAIQYAKGLGLHPQGNYKLLSGFLEGIPTDPTLTFTFGEDGIPFYVSGPYDSPEFINQVLTTLNKMVGEGKYHFMVGMENLNDLDD